MSRRSSSLNNYTSTGIARELGSKYSDVKIVADNIEDIVSVASISVEDIRMLVSLDLTSIEDVAPYINQVVTVAGAEQSILDVAADINLGVNSAILNALTNAQDAIAAAASAENSNVESLKAIAAKMTAKSYATEPVDVFVKEYTSNGDGTYTSTTTTSYSALHWYTKAEGISGVTLLEMINDSDAGHLEDAIASIEVAQQVGLHKTSIQLPKDSRVGELVKTTGAVPFGDCLKADGSLLSREEYPELWSFAESCGNIYTEEEWNKSQYLGYSFGDGVTTFRIPDWRGQFERAWDDGKGIDTNRLLGSAQDDMIKKHKHPQITLSWRTIFYAGTNRAGWYWDNNGYGKPKSTNFGGKETRPKNGAVLYCIKFKN